MTRTIEVLMARIACSCGAGCAPINGVLGADGGTSHGGGGGVPEPYDTISPAT